MQIFRVRHKKYTGNFNGPDEMTCVINEVFTERVLRETDKIVRIATVTFEELVIFIILHHHTLIWIFLDVYLIELMLNNRCRSAKLQSYQVIPNHPNP